MMRGFSLVELSVVLVILGLLTGGILSGQALIRGAQLRNFTSQHQQFLVAMNTFQDQYSSLPGDMNNATLYWGKNSAYCNGHSGNATANGTCNGNGDNWVEVAGDGDTSVSREETQVWNQLALAGLIEGAYSGVVDSSGGVERPLSKISGNTAISGWRYRNMGDLRGTVSGTLTSTFALNYGNSLELAVFSMVMLTTDEAWNIDTKIDDGKPAQGHMIARTWNTCTTAASRTDLAADYAIGDRSKSCNMMYFRGFP